MGLSATDYLRIPAEDARRLSQALVGRCSGSEVELCTIISIRTGRCAMDCAFCAQNRHSSLPPGQLMPLETLAARIQCLADGPFAHIGLVASGSALGDEELEQLCHLAQRLPSHILKRLCVSLGRLRPAQLRRLAQAGIGRYHHNLETSRSFYPHICSTQTWDQRATTIRAAQDCGLEVCSGTLFGVGESWADRIALAESLDQLDIEYIPLNFLNPRPGTPLAQRQPLPREEALRTIGLFRQLLPRATLRVCGGRPVTFGPKDASIFAWGANALMSGDYLTTPGFSLQDDLALLAASGLSVASGPGL